MAAKRITLGRDLNALLGNIKKNTTSEENDGQKIGVLELDVSRLKPGKYQPRHHMDEKTIQELADSIASQGVIQPIIVRPIDEGYEILAGERRWRAAQIAKLESVPVIVKEIPDESALALALIENIQREDLNPLEEARATSRLAEEFKLTHQDIAKLLGKNRTTISNLMRLLSLDVSVQEMLGAGQLEMGHARALLSLAPDEQKRFAHKVVNEELTVRDTEQLVRNLSNLGAKRRDKATVEPAFKNLQASISQKLQRSVRLTPTRNGRGKLVIYYKDLNDLKQIDSFISKAYEHLVVDE